MSLKDIAGLGFSVTTVGTVLLFFLGKAYYSGLFGDAGASVDDVRVEFTDLICPSMQSIVAIYHFVLTLAIRQKPVWSKEGDGLAPARGEVAYYWLRSVVFFVTLGTAAFNGLLQTACSVLVGVSMGWLVAWALGHRSTESRAVSIALAYLVLCFHARFTGQHDARSSTTIIAIQLKDQKEPLAMKKLYVASSGAYGVVVLPKEAKLATRQMLMFVPLGQIQSLSFAR
ncbi:MAG: hypothetical protein H6816_16380 [Phycisphaerales bacterium]|nr:hypothetical protein [Phycisphaerales bacterium]